MPTVNSASLRDEFDGYKTDIASLRKEGKIPRIQCASYWLVLPVGNPDCCLSRKDDQEGDYSDTLSVQSIVSEQQF